jgi:hypothetical protein
MFTLSLRKLFNEKEGDEQEGNFWFKKMVF